MCAKNTFENGWGCETPDLVAWVPASVCAHACVVGGSCGAHLHEGDPFANVGGAIPNYANRSDGPRQHRIHSSVAEKPHQLLILDIKVEIPHKDAASADVLDPLVRPHPLSHGTASAIRPLARGPVHSDVQLFHLRLISRNVSNCCYQWNECLPQQHMMNTQDICVNQCCLASGGRP